MKNWSRRPVLAVASILCLSGIAAGPAAATDTTGPTAESIAAYGVNGADEGFVKQNGYVYPYAIHVSDKDDMGDPGSGVATVEADVSSIALPNPNYDVAHVPFQLVGWPDTWGGYYTNYVRLKAVIPGGTYPWSVTMTDNNGNSTTQSSMITVDNTAPKPVDVQSANASGLTVGKADQNDTVTYTYTETMSRMIAPDTGRDVVARIENASSNDILKIFSTGNPNNEDLYIGQVKLGGNYVTSTRTFGLTGTRSKLTRSGSQITLTLGTPSGSVNTVTGSGAKMTWTQGAYGGDRSGNALIKATITETGALDREF